MYLKLSLFTFIKSTGKDGKKVILKVLSVLKTPLKLGITFLHLRKHQTLKLFMLLPLLQQEIMQVNVGIRSLDVFSVAG